jgi:NAD-dependent SIR2 family protein deacetylase
MGTARFLQNYPSEIQHGTPKGYRNHDYRRNEGFWNAYPALGRARMEFTSVASPRTFRADPQLAWGFYGHRLALYRATIPHAGFALLRRWGERMAHGLGVYTSNVDGQFQAAGFDPRRLVECHGSIHHLQCLAPCTRDIWPADAFAPQVDHEACRLANEPPRCPHCGGLARPNILMFGDWEWLEQRSEAQQERLLRWLGNARRPVVVELGAGTAIPSVRHFGQRTVHECGGRMVRINPREPTVTDPRDCGIALGALAGLQAIDALLKQPQ